MSLSGNYLVTGGAGFIGSHIAAALAGAGARVRVLDDLSTGHAENLEEIGGAVDFIRGSLTDAGALERALEGVEVVFHEAAIPSVPRSVERPLESHRACAEGTIALLDAARAAGARQVIAVVADGGDESSVRLHRAFGFVEAGRLRSVGFKHGRWLDTLLLQADLTDG